MYFKFGSAGVIIEEIEVIRVRLEQCKQQMNYASLFTEYSRYNFLKNNYDEVGNYDLCVLRKVSNCFISFLMNHLA